MEGVEQVRSWLQEIEAAETLAAAIRSQVPEADRLEKMALGLRREVIEAMGRMDVASNHNYGWEDRVLWFLNKLRAPSEA